MLADPARWPGNFLYVTLQKLKDLEKTAILFSSMDSGLGSFLPMTALGNFTASRSIPTPTTLPR
ncbi:MAG: hypothetical protein U1F77_15065 [Kiritimatiellia bacterium]